MSETLRDRLGGLRDAVLGRVPPTSTVPREVFLSFAPDDRDDAQDVRAVLQQGRQVWMGRSNRAEALRGELFLPFVSSAWSKDEEAADELDLALNEGKTVIPVLLDGGSFPELLAGVPFVDLRRRRIHKDEGKRELVRAVRSDRGSLDERRKRLGRTKQLARVLFSVVLLAIAYVLWQYLLNLTQLSDAYGRLLGFLALVGGIAYLFTPGIRKQIERRLEGDRAAIFFTSGQRPRHGRFLLFAAAIPLALIPLEWAPRSVTLTTVEAPADDGSTVSGVWDSYHPFGAYAGTVGYRPPEACRYFGLTTYVGRLNTIKPPTHLIVGVRPNGPAQIDVVLSPWIGAEEEVVGEGDPRSRAAAIPLFGLRYQNTHRHRIVLRYSEIETAPEHLQVYAYFARQDDPRAPFAAWVPLGDTAYVDAGETACDG